ncbi:citrate lyase subunit beta/citryl-CoA lyase [Dongia mobilis]|uniref:Citrate lyase subunit beta/citryl-CoA lyase n=1 Tax=Dongia mobilis TaxID=578943 RepID=A0A4R6WWU3_9PROT|nr:CoA ester lyase [Dongia mobilis]TDQ84157.1 citrate lyase subunit beta/citryl-CoA lyase [Dongia mobilis]
MQIRPRRSVLYLPASNARALEKARTLPVDGLILDLEDAVAPEAKETARTQLAAALKTGGFGRREIVVRVNGLDTPWGHDDVAALARLGPDAILFPKIQTPEEVLDCVAALDAAGAPRDLPVWIMAETPRCIMGMDAIAGASPRLACLVAGTSDLSRDLRARPAPGRIGVISALSIIVIAARAYGLDALDGVHLDLNDEAGFLAACEQGRDLGFDGKTLIHPKQIEAANIAFAPTASEVEQSRAIVAAWAEARAAGKGICVLNGKLVEKLHVEEAERLLALHDAISRMGEAAAA